MRKTRKIGVIGVGPRGGYALERFVIELVKEKCLSNIHISIFERTGNFGNGPVYDLHQNSSNWINITERILDLDRRETIETNDLKIAPFPSYKEWASKDFDSLSENKPDTYPPRSKIGDYLSLRLESLLAPLIHSKFVSMHEEQVKKVEWVDSGKLKIFTDRNAHEDFDEILLAIGHQPTEISKQITNWEKFFSNNNKVNIFKTPYPTNHYLEHGNLNESSTIGIRGFGLAMIDVVRAIANKFGRFVTINEETKSCKYVSEQQIKDFLIPFSLDGLPPVPKPLNAPIDNWFKPSEKAILAFEKKIGDKSVQRKADSPNFLIDSFVPIAASIYMERSNTNRPDDLSRKEIEPLIGQWLKNQSFDHWLFIPTGQPPEKSMGEHVEMAIGKRAISLDFCIGQVWRHCQPSIYEALSFNECSNEVFAEIIQLDESTKRYSYGPPVESIQQILSLVDVGVLNLNFANDPNIKLTDEGWQLNTEKESITVNIMIDSVLDSPKIKAVKTKLVKELLSDNLIQAVHDEFGVATDENGYLLSDDINRKIPIALLGRLAKGTIIGVDAILECFGSRPRHWARKAATHHINWLNKNL